MTEPLTLEGVPEFLRKLEHPEWAIGPMGQFLDRWRFAVQRAAVRNIKRGPHGWLDTAETRKSITSERDGADAFPGMDARVGSNLDKARWGDMGTGTLSEDPESKKQAYYPPPDRLQNWALRHGFEDIPSKDGSQNIWRTAGGQVSRIIGRRGGTEPRRFLRDAADEIRPDIPRYLQMMASDIEQAAERHGSG